MQRNAWTLALLLSAAAASGNTYTVTSTADSGAGTLRQAILDANGHAGADTIGFNIVGGGVHTISLATALPAISDALTIDGYTQSGSSPNTHPVGQGLDTVLTIEIEGSALGNVACISAQADGVTLRGLVVNRCTGYEITAGGNHQNLAIEGCFLGSDPTGTQGLEPFHGAIEIGQFTNAHIGGITPAARNLISGGGTGSVQMVVGNFSPGVTGIVIQGNLIGTDVTGTHRFTESSVQKGVNLILGSNNLIGGTSEAARNVIPGGIILGGSGNLVQGNFLGIDVTGTKVLGCHNSCVELNGANNTVGGSAAGAGNRIGGSDRSGIMVLSTGDGAIIQGNFIGTDEAGVVSIPNEYLGVEVSGATGVVVGGTGPGEGNVVTRTFFYGGVGVGASGVATIRGNSIFENVGGNASVGLGIDLYVSTPNGVLFNDAGDTDTGANGLQNYPVISGVTYGASTTTVAGTLDSAASTIFDVDFYSNPTCSRRPQDLPEGKTFIGTKQVTTDGSGHAVISAVLPVGVPAGSPITATATDPGGNTSEFSPRFVISATPGWGSPIAAAVTLKGLAFESGATVTVGGLPATNVNVTDVHTLSMNTPHLNPGTVNAIAVSIPGGLSGTLPNGFIADFTDVPSNNQFYLYVTRLVASGITAGVGGGFYGVNQGTKRQQMAAFLLKSKFGVCYQPPPCVGTFPDVPCSNIFAAWIEALAAAGITGGCGGGNYCPDNIVTRQQMAVFLLKAKHGSSYVPPPCQGDYLDVACPGNPFANWIEQLGAEGITGGCGGGNYCPGNNVTRGQMAAFLVNTFKLP